jgi:hypothetical protein
MNGARPILQQVAQRGFVFIRKFKPLAYARGSAAPM